jgi:hypothetical protein
MDSISSNQAPACLAGGGGPNKKKQTTTKSTKIGNGKKTGSIYDPGREDSLFCLTAAGWMDGWIYVKMEMYSIFFSSATGSIKRAAGLFASQEGGVKSILLLLLGWRAICRIYIGRFM